MSEFDSAGVRIHYVEAGEGAPVVLLHGYTSNLAEQWVATGVVPALARANRVIAFDARGHGRSGKPHETSAYGAEMARDVVRLLNHLGLAKAHVIGYSMGAHILAQLLTLHPERVLSAILGGGAGRRDWSEADERRVRREAEEMDRGRLDTHLLRLWPPEQPKPDIQQLEDLSRSFLIGKDHKALAAIRRSNAKQAVTSAQMAAVSVPVLGIVGNEDAYLAELRALSQVMPQLKLVVLDGATHASAPAHPGFVPAVQAFLAAHDVE